MKIFFKTKKLEKTFSKAENIQKIYGKQNARKIFQRLQEIQAATSIEELLQGKIGRCHALSHNRNGQYAMDLVHPYRLVFRVEPIDKAIIIEIIDYH